MSKLPASEPVDQREIIEMPAQRHKFIKFIFHPTNANILYALEQDEMPQDLDSYKLVSLEEVYGQRKEMTKSRENDKIVKQELARQSMPSALDIGSQLDTYDDADEQDDQQENTFFKKGTGDVSFQQEAIYSRKRIIENAQEYQVAVSMWDISTEAPLQVYEKRFWGFKADNLTFSTNENFLLLSYQKEEVNELENGNKTSVIWTQAAVLGTEDLNVVADFQIGPKASNLQVINLVNNAQFIFARDPISTDCELQLFKVPTQGEIMVEEPQINLKGQGQFEYLQKEMIIFTEKANGKFYYLQAPNIKEEDSNEYSLYEFELQNLLSPKKLWTTKVKNIEGFSRLWPDKEFEKIYARDSNDNKVVIFEFATGKVEKLKGIGKKIVPNKSSHLRKNQLIYHCDEEGKRYIRDLKSNKNYLSANQDPDIETIDVTWNHSLSRYVEAFRDKTEKMIGLSRVTENSQKFIELRKISRFSFHFPYIAFFKGNQQLIIRNFHSVRESLVFKLPQGEYFRSFIDTSSEEVFQKEEMKEEETFRGIQESKKKGLLNSLNSEVFTYLSFMTFGLQGVKIHTMKLYPYLDPSRFVLQHFSFQTSLKPQQLKRKNIICLHMQKKTIYKGNKKQDLTLLIIQYEDMIYIKAYGYPYEKVISEGLADKKMIRMPREDQDKPDSDFLLVTDTEFTSKLQVLSFAEGLQDPVTDAFKIRGNRIISITTNVEEVFAFLDNFTCKVFQVKHNNNKRIHLDYNITLELTQQSQEQMEAEAYLFTAFHDLHMTEDYCLHIKDKVYFYIEPGAFLESFKKAQQMGLMENQIYKKNFNYDSGPLVYDLEVDNVAYFFKGKDEDQEGQLILKRCVDMKTNILVQGTVSFASFISTDQPCSEKLIVLIGRNFFLFKPNGEIEQFIEIQDERFEEQEEITVDDVSDNLRFFIFHQFQNQVFELHYDQELNKYSFRVFSTFSLVPNTSDAAYLEKRKRTTQSSMENTNAGQKKKAGSIREVQPLPLEIEPDMSMSRMVEKEEEGNKDLPSARNRNYFNYPELIDSEAVNERQGFRHVLDTREIGDDGSIWNLYFDEQVQKVRLRVDRENYEQQDFVPQSIQDFIKLDPNNEIKMILLAEHLVLANTKVGQVDIHYVRVDVDKNLILSSQMTKCTLDISKEWQLKNIRQVEAKDRVQFQIFKPESSLTAIVTWNLDKNIEDREFEIQGDESFTFLKGMHSSLNFMQDSEYLYDLEFNFPHKLFGNIQYYKNMSRFFEASVNEGKDLLVLRTEERLEMGVTINSTQRSMLMLFEELKDGALQKTAFPFCLAPFMTQDGSTIFHFLVTDIKLLKNYHEDLMKFIDTVEDEDEKEEYLYQYCLLFYPNIKNISPFDIAVQKSSQYVDMMLQMMAQIPNSFQVQRYVFNNLAVFGSLMEMGLPSFHDFLERCTYQTRMMETTQVRFWIHGDEEEAFIAHNTSFMTEPFLNQFIGQKENEDVFYSNNSNIIEQKQSEELKQSYFDSMQKEVDFADIRKERLADLDVILKKKQSKLDQKEQIFGGTEKRIVLQILEFDWIFKGKEGQFFIDQLAYHAEDDIFQLQTIRLAIDFLWSYYFWNIFFYVGVPNFIFFAAFLTYSSLSFDEQGETKESAIEWAFGIFSICYSTFMLLSEVKQVWTQGLEYFNSTTLFWNLVDLGALIMVIVTVIVDFSQTVEIETTLAINSVAAFMCWLKFFYFLRIFKETSSFIRMITETIKDMGVFSLIYLMANLAFANAFFLLDGGFTKVKEERYVSDKWWYTIIWTYITGLGEFDTDYDGIMNETMYWIFFILCTVLIQIVFLNTLIAIMGDTFGRVQEIKEEASLREKCSLIAENWQYLNQEKVFNQTKYVIHAKLEQAQDSSDSVIDHKINDLKKHFQSGLQNIKKNLKNYKNQQTESFERLEKKFMERLKSQTDFQIQSFKRLRKMLKDKQ